MEGPSEGRGWGERLLPTLVCVGLFGGCGNSTAAAVAPSEQLPHMKAEVARTAHGVVHVRADDFRALGYGLAYAYAQDTLYMFADSLLTVRGERSEFFGP